MRIVDLRGIPGSENIDEGAVAAWFDFDRFSHIERWDYDTESSVNLSFSGDAVCFVFKDKGNADNFIKGVLEIVKENAQ